MFLLSLPISQKGLSPSIVNFGPREPDQAQLVHEFQKGRAPILALFRTSAVS